MAYGKIKADTLVYDNSGSDVEVALSTLGNKANLASPTFTGTPAAPTAAANTNTTQIATTAYVQGELTDRAPLPASAGTVAASEVVQVDANKDTTGIRNLTISGNLQVNGTTTTVASSTMTVTDKNIEIAKGAANDAAADGAGITIDSGDGDKTWNWVDATDAWTSSEHIHLGNSKELKLGADQDLKILHVDGSGNWIKSFTTNTLYIEANGDTHIISNNADVCAKFIKDGSVELYEDNVKKFETTATGVTVTGTVSDSKGELRTIPQLSKSSKHTIVLADAGKHSINSSGGWELDTSTAFTAGMAITLINNSGSDQTIEADGVTLYNTADAATGNRTLAGRGMATVICTASNTYYISGAGLS